MPGVPGRGGRPPKRAADRVRRNKVDIDTVKVSGDVPVPDADASWHQIAIDWYESLARSGQSNYYEPSDWALAQYAAHMMSHNLTQARPSSEWFKGVWAAANDLMSTEASRRRLRMEIERAGRSGDSVPPAATGTDGKVSRLDDYRAL